VAISDYTADLRAATPSAAAELVSPDRFEWLGRFEQLARSLTRIMQNRLSQQRFNLLQLVKRLRHPKDKLQENMQRLDMAQMRLNNSLQRQLSSQQAHLTGLSHRLQSNKPDKQITQMKQAVQHLQQRMQHSLQLQLQDFKNRLARQAEVLNAVSPLSTLSRGYAIVTTELGEAVRTSSQVKVGDTVTAKLHEGSFSCSVDQIHKVKS
jgi:exodeoxyribonuclease VII large subunit